jgi:hypothetical protein
MRVTSTLALAIVLGTVAHAGAGNVIYDNLAATTYTPNSGDTVSTAASVLGFDSSHSETFTAATTDNLGAVLIAMWNVTGDNTFDLTLTDSSSNTLETFTGIAAAPIVPGASVVTVDSVVHPLLTAGDSYTLSAVATGTTWDAWDVTISLHGGSGFRVLGASVVPEPSSLTMLVGAFVGLGVFYRRRLLRKA